MERYPVLDPFTEARLGLACAAAVYAASFFMPVGDLRGWQVFLLGAVACVTISVLVTWPWLANIAFLVGCFFLLVGQPKRARNAGLLATALALGLLLEVGFSPAGLGIGYLAWVASMALLTVAAGRAV
jgi:hypothetical protein